MPTQVPVSDGSKHKADSARLSKFNWFKLRNALLFLAIVGLVAFAYEYIHTRNQLKQLSNPSSSGQTQAQQIVSQINKTIALPPDENPTLATVTDVAKLRSQNFFKNAQDGDKVLIYSKSGQAVLYRPSTKQVIEYAPINLSQ